jgi:hypothetical protein
MLVVAAKVMFAVAVLCCTVSRKKVRVVRSSFRIYGARSSPNISGLISCIRDPIYPGSYSYSTDAYFFLNSSSLS